MNCGEGGGGETRRRLKLHTGNNENNEKTKRQKQQRFVSSNRTNMSLEKCAHACSMGVYVQYIHIHKHTYTHIYVHTYIYINITIVHNTDFNKTWRKILILNNLIFIRFLIFATAEISCTDQGRGGGNLSVCVCCRRPTWRTDISILGPSVDSNFLIAINRIAPRVNSVILTSFQYQYLIDISMYFFDNTNMYIYYTHTHVYIGIVQALFKAFWPNILRPNKRGTAL